MVRGNKILKLMGSLIIICFLIFVMDRHSTMAWFISETKASGHLENAKAEDILSVTSNVVSYAKDGTVTIQIDLVNKSEVIVPINLEPYQVNLSSGESFSGVFHKKVSSGMTEVHFQLKGFNHYINELISIPVNQKLMQEYTKEIEKKNVDEEYMGLADTKVESAGDEEPNAD